jgi:cell division protease FtsH
VAREIDKEVRRIVAEAHDRAQEILTRFKELHLAIAQRLIQVETLDADEFEAFFANVPGVPPRQVEPSTPPAQRVPSRTPGTQAPGSERPNQNPNPKPAPA